MQLTIDTQADSKEDLRKVIRFLELVVSEREHVFDNDTIEKQSAPSETPPAVTQFLNMFDTPTRTVTTPPPKKETFKIDFF